MSEIGSFIPFRKAIIVGDVAVVQRMLSDKVMLKASLSLHVCAANELSEQLVDLLVQAGADPDDVDDDGFYPIHRHVCNNRIHGVSSLLSLGAAVDAKASDGNQPLHYAARLRNAEMILLLLAHGADPNARNNNGESPGDLCELGFWESTTKMTSARV